MSDFDYSEESKARKADLLLLSTGTLSTAHLPFWLNWLSTNRPNYSVVAGLTETARKFVSPTAIEQLTGSPVLTNSWTFGDRLKPVHTSIANDYSVTIVYPASINFLSELASGSGRSPFVLGLLGTRTPVFLCPSFPPNVAQNKIVMEILEKISGVENYHVLRGPKKKSRSVDIEAETTSPLWNVISAFEAIEDNAAARS